jgi:hypothetical protein
MSVRELRHRLQKQPFEPFRVVLSSGESYEVRHPEMALLLRGGIYVAEPDAKGELPEVPAWCSYLHITAIEPIAAKNGRQPRKK